MQDHTSIGKASANSAWDEMRWQRYGLLAGVIFVVLNVISTFAAGAPPARDASAEKIAKYFVDHDDGIKLGAILFGIALIFGLWWLGSLWRTIGRIEPAGPRLALIAVFGFAMSGVMAGMAQAVFVAPALRVEALSGATEFAWSVGFVAYSLALATTAAHMLALGALIMWKQFLPMWMGWLAMLSAMACAVATIGVGSESGTLAVFQIIGFLSWMLWILLASVLLYVRKEASASSA